MTKTVIIKEDKYKVEVDGYNHTLYMYDPGGYEVRIPGKKGMQVKKAGWDIMGYFPNMKQCITRCIEKQVELGDNCDSIESYLQQLTEATKDLHGRMTL